jgi:hypothetical protein
MKEFKLTDHKTPENIHRRVWTKSKNYSRSILYPLSETGKYDLQSGHVTLEEGEIPIDESYTDNSYLLVTTLFIHSIIFLLNKNPRIQKYDRYKVRVEDIRYNGSIYEVIEERHNRFHYQECVLKHIDTVNNYSIPVYVFTGVDENIFFEVLTQLFWLSNKYRNQDNNQQI